MSSAITLLSGGVGQELQRRSSMPVSPLWSTQVLMDEPHLVEQVHRDYIAAGVDVITLAAYASTPIRLARDADESLFEPTQNAALDSAIRARADSGNMAVRIGGCLPPLVSSYRHDLVPDAAECLDNFHRIVAVQNRGADLFLCETMSNLREARCAVTAAATTGKPVYCGVTVDDSDGSKLRSGEAIEAVAESAMAAGAAAFLINCSFPEAVTQSLECLRHLNIPKGGYANAFTSITNLQPGGTVDVLKARQDLGPAAYAEHAMHWLDLGATIIGGCCEVGPGHIAMLGRRLGKI